MTILPKKKQSKEKNESTSSEHPHGHQLPHNSPPGVDQRHDSRVASRRPSSPPQRWGSPTAREDPCLAGGHDPGGLFDEQGASGHNKRRHRSSPHRNIRKHRVWDSGHPSTSGHAHRHSNYPTEIPSTSEELDEDDPNLTEGNLDGYNSGDEYGPPTQDRVPDNVEQLELWFERAMKEKTGFIIKKMHEDGACLFRAVADQVYGDQEMHDIVRKNCIDYMAKNADFFRHYVTEDFDTYLNRKRITSSHGNHIEIQAMSEIYNRPIEVYQYSIEPINTFHGSYKTDNEPIRLSYHKGVHYNSVINPVKATIGVGLGLPGLQPGLAEKNLMREAVRQSEEYHIETTMLEDKLRETDWELTQESIDEQVARESYLQWLRDQEKNANKPSSNASKTASATCSSASESQMMWDGNMASNDSWAARSPRNRSNNTSSQNSPNQVSDDLSSPKATDTQQFLLPGGSMSPSSPRPSTATGDMNHGSHSTEGAVGGSFLETSSLVNDVQSEVLAYAGWDEDDILAQVIAQSQQEYLDSLKKSSSASCSSSSHDDNNHSTMGTSYGKSSTDKAVNSKNSHSNTKSSSGKVS